MQTSFHYSPDSQLLGMPYSPQVKGDRIDNGYIHLETEPERIEEIHEVRDFPELKQLLLDFLSPGSAFISWRVATEWDVSSHLQPGFPHCMCSLLTIISRSENLNNIQYYQGLLGVVQEYGLDTSVSDQTRIKFFATKAVVKSWEYDGVCLDIWIFGDGHSRTQARGNWLEGLRAVEAALKAQFQQPLSKI